MLKYTWVKKFKIVYFRCTIADRIQETNLSSYTSKTYPVSANTNRNIKNRTDNNGKAMKNSTDSNGHVNRSKIRESNETFDSGKIVL
jgi:hypothetical protein